MSYSSYNQPPVYNARSSTWALLSLIAGIGAFTFLPGIGPIAALICGYVAKGEIRNGRGLVTGNGMATAGLVLGWISIVLSCIGLCLTILIFTGTLAAPTCLVPVFENLNMNY